MTSSSILVNTIWFRRACAILAAAEGMVLAWMVVRAGDSATFVAWCGVLVCVVSIAVAWPPLWRSISIRAIAWEGKSGTRLQIWRDGASVAESMALAWCWWWGGRLAMLGLTSGRATSWVLVDASGADPAATAGFYRGLREATVRRSADGVRW